MLGKGLPEYLFENEASFGAQEWSPWLLEGSHGLLEGSPRPGCESGGLWGRRSPFGGPNLGLCDDQKE